jgi:hypothetical protein
MTTLVSYPHFTSEDIIPLFQSHSIDLKGWKVVPLLDGATGYLTFSEDEETAYFTDPNGKRLGVVKLYARLCDNSECTEQHVWLLSECSHHTVIEEAQIASGEFEPEEFSGELK